MPTKPPDPIHRIDVVREVDCNAGNNGATICGPTFARVCVLASCQCNARNAMCNRHMAVPGNPRENPNLVRKVVREYLAGLPRVEWSYGLFEEWVERFAPARAAALREALADGPCRGGRLNLTIKHEMSWIEVSKARAIQAYGDLWVQCMTGPVIWRLSELIKKRGAHSLRGNVLHYVPGMTGAEISSTCRDTPPWHNWAESDGKNWDASVSGNTRRALIDAMESHLEPFVIQLLRDGVDATGVCFAGGGFIKYAVRGTVKSGHNDTTLGNTLLNLATNCASVTGCAIWCAGDDALVSGPPDQLRVLGEGLRRFGVEPVGGVFEHLSDVTLISGRFCGTAFVPKVGNQLGRLYATASTVSVKERACFGDRIRGSVPHYSDAPILGALVAGPAGRPVVQNWQREEQRTGVADYIDFGVSCGVLFGEARDLEFYILSLACAAGLYSHPVADAIIAYDKLDPHERPSCLYAV